jgi:hypothetical protein
MKKITALILIILSFSFALPINECKTDIYFVNGVWNTEDQARDSAKKLYQTIKELIKNTEMSNYYIIQAMGHKQIY